LGIELGAGLDDLAMLGEAIEQRSCHLCIAEGAETKAWLAMIEVRS